jgi:hypothetical protein
MTLTFSTGRLVAAQARDRHEGTEQNLRQELRELDVSPQTLATFLFVADGVYSQAEGMSLAPNPVGL